MAIQSRGCLGIEKSRTFDLRFRKPLLYPEELLGSRSSELILNSTSADASKNTYLKGVSKPYLQVKVQSSGEIGALENGFGSQPRSKVQRSVSGCCKFRALSCGKIATESRSRWDGGGGRVTANQRSPVLQSGPSYASEFGRTLSLVRQWHHVHLRSLVDIARDRRLRRFRHLIIPDKVLGTQKRSYSVQQHLVRIDNSITSVRRRRQ